MNVKVFNLISEVTKTRFQFSMNHVSADVPENESVWYSKQKWYHDECWCKCKELDDWRSCKYDW